MKSPGISKNRCETGNWKSPGKVWEKFGNLALKNLWEPWQQYQDIEETTVKIKKKTLDAQNNNSTCPKMEQLGFTMQ